MSDERTIDVEARSTSGDGSVQPVRSEQASGGSARDVLDDPRQDGCVGTFLAIMSVLIGAIYIVNPGFGVIEFIPDHLPFVGNLDEAGFTALMIFGLQSLGRRFRRKQDEI